MNAALQAADAEYKAHVRTCEKCQRGEARLTERDIPEHDTTIAGKPVRFAPVTGCDRMREIFHDLQSALAGGTPKTQNPAVRKPPKPRKGRIGTGGPRGRRMSVLEPILESIVIDGAEIANRDYVKAMLELIQPGQVVELSVSGRKPVPASFLGIVPEEYPDE